MAGLARGAGGPTPERATIRLGYRPPYDVDSMLSFWAQRALPGVEEVGERCLRRSLSLAATDGGAAVAGWLEARFADDRPVLELRASANCASHWAQVIEAARHAFDIDADPLRTAPLLEALAARHPRTPMRAGLRVPGSFDGFETAVRVILGQQVSVAAARTLAARVVARFGAPVATPWAGVDRCFPSAATLAAASAEDIGTLGIVRQRVAALQALARAVDAGLPLHRGAPLASTLAALNELPGIGDWTLQLLALRVLAWPDAFPATDIGVLKAMGLARAADAARAVAEAVAWRPWRSYAVIALWRALETPKDPSP